MKFKETDNGKDGVTKGKRGRKPQDESKYAEESEKKIADLMLQLQTTVDKKEK